MTPEHLDRLAALIAAELRRVGGDAPAAASAGPWLAPPVRPEPPPRTGIVPAWSGAGQSLGDVAPIRHPVPSVHRDDFAEATAAVRGAAAGKGDRRAPGASRDASSGTTPAPRHAAARRRAVGAIQVPVGVSRRHLHLSEAHARALFGSASLAVHRPLRQPGQFAAVQVAAAVGPKGRLEGIRIVGPPRGETQLELARSDAAVLGVAPLLASSGTLEGSLGGVTLVGPHGRVELARGVIVAARHLHVAPHDGLRWGVRDGDRLDLRCGEGARAVTWHDVLVRCGPTHATEFHLDEDEAHAAGVTTGEMATIVGWRPSEPQRRPLVTERDLLERVRRGAGIPANAILTPGARDRARALGIDIP